MATLKLKELNASSSKVRAFRLRKKKATGKINAAELEWLKNYESAQAVAAKFRIGKKPATPPHQKTPTVPLPPRQQLGLPHTTQPTEKIAGADELFTPAVSPIQADGTEGKPEPVLSAAPTIDEAAHEASSEQVAALVALVVAAGAESAKRMAAANQLPGAQMLIALGATSDGATAALVAHVRAAAKRVALKHSATLIIPYADEVTIAAALAGSTAAVVYERKLLAAPPKDSAPTEAPPEPIKAPTRSEARFYK